MDSRQSAWKCAPARGWGNPKGVNGQQGPNTSYPPGLEPHAPGVVRQGESERSQNNFNAMDPPAGAPNTSPHQSSVWQGRGRGRGMGGRGGTRQQTGMQSPQDYSGQHGQAAYAAENRMPGHGRGRGVGRSAGRGVGRGSNPGRSAWQNPPPPPKVQYGFNQESSDDEAGPVVSSITRQMQNTKLDDPVQSSASNNAYSNEPQVLASLHQQEHIAAMVGEYDPNVPDPSNSMLRVAVKEWDPQKLEEGCKLLSQGVGKKLAARQVGVLAADLQKYWDAHYEESDGYYDSSDSG